MPITIDGMIEILRGMLKENVDGSTEVVVDRDWSLVPIDEVRIKEATNYEVQEPGEEKKVVIT